MDTILQGVPNTICYLDDIILVTRKKQDRAFEESRGGIKASLVAVLGHNIVRILKVQAHQPTCKC